MSALQLALDKVTANSKAKLALLPVASMGSLTAVCLKGRRLCGASNVDKRIFVPRRKTCGPLKSFQQLAGFASALLVLVVSSGGVNAAPDILNGARSTLEQWVQTRQLISKTRSDWQADKELLEQSIRMFERELQSLNDQLAGVSTNRTRADEERDAALGQQRELNAALDSARALAESLEQRVRALAPAFPPSLAEKVQPLLNRVPADSATTKAGPVERLQTIVALLNEVDKFNAAVTVVSEVRKNPAGAEVQVETIYVGLAQAYFVDKAGQYAGVGVPTPQGWQWTERSELVEPVRKAIAVYKNAAPAAFVALPVRIQ